MIEKYVNVILSIGCNNNRLNVTFIFDLHPSIQRKKNNGMGSNENTRQNEEMGSYPISDSSVNEVDTHSTGRSEILLPFTALTQTLPSIKF